MEETSKKVKRKRTKDENQEIVIVVMLGITALLTAWASWIGALHGGNQAANYTRSNNLASEGNSEYNAGVQSLMQDMMLYNEINSLLIDLHFAEQRNDTDTMESIQWKVDELVNSNMSDEFYEAYEWAIAETETRGESVSPFEMESFIDSYFVTANDLLTQSEEALEQGSSDNQYDDAFGLVTVIYSVVLFLLGVASSFKNNTTAVVIISCTAFLVATVYMFTIPMPTGFSISSFFGS